MSLIQVTSDPPDLLMIRHSNIAAVGFSAWGPSTRRHTASVYAESLTYDGFTRGGRTLDPRIRLCGHGCQNSLRSLLDECFVGKVHVSCQIPWHSSNSSYELAQHHWVSGKLRACHRLRAASCTCPVFDSRMVHHFCLM